jgi:Holliday junction resolvase RusA-like endonuclease
MEAAVRMNIRIHVPAVPVAQPRPRATLARGGKGARMHEVTHIKQADGTRKPHPIAAYKATVRHAVVEAYQGAPLEGPLSVAVLCVMPRNKAMRWKTKPTPRVRHTCTPDCDNLAKSTLDALKQLLWVDDAQIWQLTVEKWIAAGDEQPHVVISVSTLSED